MAETYDFIVVGSGPSGSTVARRLADSSPSIKVLLLEAGGDNANPDLRSPSNRYLLPHTQPSVTYGYKSTPQSHLNNREISCARGRGLGGSSANNFCVWIRGDKGDFNAWADIVGDDAWKWEGPGGVEQRFRKIENLHSNLTKTQAKYLDRELSSTHSEGKVDLSYGNEWPEIGTTTREAATELGMKLNTNGNSGDSTGWFLPPSTFYNGARTTAATAYLSSPPSNLTIKVESAVSQVIFSESKIATGVKTLGGTTYHASKEVILSAGTIDTPKILLLSGVGPAADLLSFSIPVVADVPAVGKNMKDHCYSTTTLLLKPEASVPEPNPFGDVGIQSMTGWFSSLAVKSSNEFGSLDQHTKAILAKLPSFQHITNHIPMGTDLPAVAFEPGSKVLTFLGLVMNTQSSGSITLASSNPLVAPLIDVNYLNHPYDRRVAIESLRSAYALSEAPSIAAITERRIEGPPAGADDETLWEWIKHSVNSVMHFAGTCKMGKDDDENAVVDTGFRVRGVKGLRVVDVSITPWLPNNHTQSTAYLIGETAAEKIIAEYGF